MPHGRLTVIVEGATDIIDPSFDGRGSSYCTLQCGGQVYSTRTAEGGGTQPVFNTSFEFEIDRSTNELLVSIFSKEYPRGNDMVAYTTLDFKQVFYHGHSVDSTAFPLLQPSGNAHGHINMSLTFKARPSPYAQNAHAPGRQYSAPPYGAHQQPARNQLNPRGEAETYENYSSYDDGYGSSGSGQYSPSGHTYRRSRSEPNHHEDYGLNADYFDEPGTPSHNYEEAPPNYTNYNQHPNSSPRHGHQAPQRHMARPSPHNFGRPNVPQYHHAQPKPQYNQAVQQPRRAVPGGPQTPIASQPRPAIPGRRVEYNVAARPQPPTLQPQPQIRQQPQQQIRQQPRQQRYQPPQQIRQQPRQQRYQPPQQPGAMMVQAMAHQVVQAGVEAVAGETVNAVAGELFGGVVDGLLGGLGDLFG